MLLVDFLPYVRQQGLQSRDWVFIVLGLLMLVLAGVTARQTWRLVQQQKPLSWADVVGPVAGLFLGGVFILPVYGSLHDRYLLRDEAAHFTTGRVYEHTTQRGESRLTFEYYVAGQRYQSAQACGELRDPPFPCLPVGTRCFVRFAPEQPGTAQLLATPVPDSLRHVPVDGWARLP